MRYKNLDLNLLVALDALLEEKNITKAALRLNFSQSAMSGMLARLRTFFGDKLLVPIGRTMQRTTLGNELAGPVRELLLKIENTITFRQDFVPYDALRHFRIAASDYSLFVLLAPLIRRMQNLAPSMTFELMPLLASTSDIVKSGQADLVVTSEEHASQEQPQEHLLSDSYSCMVWTGNESVKDLIDIKLFAACGHVTPVFSGLRNYSLDERIFREHGIERRVQVITPDFESMAQMIVETCLIATMPTRLATSCVKRYAVRLLTPPLTLPSLRLCMQWHRNLTEDPCHSWLRTELSALAKTLV